jgi:hypothetical protein
VFTCGNFYRLQDDGTRIRGVAVRCKQWTCSRCAKDNIRKVRAQIAAGKPTKFLTLTVNPRVGSSPGDRARRASGQIKYLVRAIKREYGLPRLPYWLGVEAHKSGEPHFHLVLRAPYIDKAWLSQRWEELTGAYVVDIGLVRDPTSVGFYLTKYLSKGLEKYAGVQRFRMSRDWIIERDVKPEHDWKCVPARIMGAPFLAHMLAALREGAWKDITSDGTRFTATRPRPGVPVPYWESFADEADFWPPRRKRGPPDAEAIAA